MITFLSLGFLREAKHRFVILKFFSLYACFPYQFKMVVFHRSLTDIKSPQVSRTILSILANPNIDVVLILLIVSASSLFYRFLGTV